MICFTMMLTFFKLTITRLFWHFPKGYYMFLLLESFSFGIFLWIMSLLKFHSQCSGYLIDSPVTYRKMLLIMVWVTFCSDVWLLITSTKFPVLCQCWLSVCLHLPASSLYTSLHRQSSYLLLFQILPQGHPLLSCLQESRQLQLEIFI